MLYCSGKGQSSLPKMIQTAITILMLHDTFLLIHSFLLKHLFWCPRRTDLSLTISSKSELFSKSGIHILH